VELEKPTRNGEKNLVLLTNLPQEVADAFTVAELYRARWGIEPMFSDFKSRGFQLEDTQLRAADRLDRLLVIMALAMYWCVRVGQEEARDHPTPLEKNSRSNGPPPLDL
jgi:IS4 transposase